MEKQVHIMDHPLILHKISMLRCKDTSVKDFRELAYEIALLMGYEATRDLALTEREVETPLAKTTGRFVDKQVALVPILRAGLGMVDALMSLIPAAKVGHIGLYRDHETLQPVEYYCKLPPDIAERQVLVLDPMLATGGAARRQSTSLKNAVQSALSSCIIASPEGVEVVTKAHPDVEVFCGIVDERLNENGYIVPGLGDAGDRLFGTI